MIYHLAAAFRVPLKPDCTFPEAAEKHEFQVLRIMMSELVLALNMAEHNRTSMTLSYDATGDGAQFAPAFATEAMLVLKTALKCADLGHLTMR